MKNTPHNWRITLLCLPAALVLGGMGWVCVSAVNRLGVVMLDKTKFENDHNLPRAYEYHMTRNLTTLQRAAIEYAEYHKGLLPPMQNLSAAISALRPYLQHKIAWCTYNPATRLPFMPNAALSGQKIGALGRNALLFYDADPPTGYRESYYITPNGIVGHVPASDLAKLLAVSRQD